MFTYLDCQASITQTIWHLLPRSPDIHYPDHLTAGRSLLQTNTEAKNAGLFLLKTVSFSSKSSFLIFWTLGCYWVVFPNLQILRLFNKTRLVLAKLPYSFMFGGHGDTTLYLLNCSHPRTCNFSQWIKILFIDIIYLLI